MAIISASTGNLFPSTVVNDSSVGSTAWSNTSNAISQGDDTYATAMNGPNRGIYGAMLVIDNVAVGQYNLDYEGMHYRTYSEKAQYYGEFNIDALDLVGSDVNTTTFGYAFRGDAVINTTQHLKATNFGASDIPDDAIIDKISFSLWLGFHGGTDTPYSIDVYDMSLAIDYRYDGVVGATNITITSPMVVSSDDMNTIWKHDQAEYYITGIPHYSLSGTGSDDIIRVDVSTNWHGEQVTDTSSWSVADISMDIGDGDHNVYHNIWVIGYTEGGEYAIAQMRVIWCPTPISATHLKVWIDYPSDITFFGVSDTNYIGDGISSRLYPVSQSQVSVRGHTTDDAGVSSMTCENTATGVFYPVVGNFEGGQTVYWEVDGIVLVPGNNTIIMRGTSTSGGTNYGDANFIYLVPGVTSPSENTGVVMTEVTEDGAPTWYVLHPAYGSTFPGGPLWDGYKFDNYASAKAYFDCTSTVDAVSGTGILTETELGIMPKMWRTRTTTDFPGEVEGHEPLYLMKGISMLEIKGKRVGDIFKRVDDANVFDRD